MAILFFVIGILSLGISFYFYTKKETSTISTEEKNKQKGDDFEDYLIQLIGKQNDVQFVGKVSDYHKDGVSALENVEPDLKFKFKNIPFAVECKWRRSFVNGKINWAKNYQVKNYNDYSKSKKEKVFVAIGIGGSPNAPEKLFLVPLYRLTQDFAIESYIQEFQIENSEEMGAILKNLF